MNVTKMKRTKIVCTIGPASENETTLGKMIDAGLNVCRLNFSHGNHEEHKARIDLIKNLREKKNKSIAIILDTKGPEIRTGEFESNDTILTAGQIFTITMEDVIGNDKKCTVSYKNLVYDVSVGNKILFDDGLIELEVEGKSQRDIICVVKNTGTISSRKGVNVPNVKINLPALTQKDEEDIIFGIENGIDYIAASFVRKAEDVLEIRRVLEEHGGDRIKIISKIENQEGVDNVVEILEVSDGIMVARGDLGVEIPTEDIPLVQKHLISLCNNMSKPVITATQMLDSMIRNPRPTRAETTDVSNAIFDGTDAIMLSGETASGKYPVEAVKMMTRIAYKTEEQLDYERMVKSKKEAKQTTITNAISHATCTTAMDLNAKSIITATSGGYTARMVSSYRPKAPIIATTSDEVTYKQMSLLWGVHPLLNPEVSNTDDLIEISINEAIKEDLAEIGDLVVITAGVPVGKSGTTNLLKVHIVTDTIVKGVGIGAGNVRAKARIIINGNEKFDEGDILIAKTTDKDMMELIKKASAIVTEVGGLTSHAAIVGINLGKPVVVSAAEATNKIPNGEIITVDAEAGAVYLGEVKVL